MSPRPSRPRVIARLAVLFSGASAATGFQCRSDVALGATAHSSGKGVNLDDSTYRWCAQQVPDAWPNSEEPLSSIRIFKAWNPSWNADERLGAWARLANYVRRVNATVLIGTPISCDEAADNQMWEWAKELLGMLDHAHVMGLAIGNELELLQFKGVSDACLQEIWENDYLWRQFQRMVDEFDALGFGAAPVTSVFAGLALDGSPFYEVAGKARVNSFLANATGAYGDRFAFTWNIYPYFDTGLQLDEGTSDSCGSAVAVATCFEENCSLPSQARLARSKMTELTGDANATMWIGETGWSSPMSSTLETPLANCPQWSSAETFQAYYSAFLQWDLDIGGGLRPPDHVFWFTMRDSYNFGSEEHFGLIASCDEPKCKVASESFVAQDYEVFFGPGNEQCEGPAGFIVYNGFSRGEEHCRNMCTLDDACEFYGIWPHSYDGNYWCMLTRTCEWRSGVSFEVTVRKKVHSHNSMTTATTPTQTTSFATATTTGAATTATEAAASASTTMTGAVDKVDVATGVRASALCLLLPALAIATSASLVVR